jgi:hypothetical protein
MKQTPAALGGAGVSCDHESPVAAARGMHIRQFPSRFMVPDLEKPGAAKPRATSRATARRSRQPRNAGQSRNSRHARKARNSSHFHQNVTQDQPLTRMTDS